MDPSLLDERVASQIFAAQGDFAQVLKSGELKKWWKALDMNGNGLVSLSEVETFTRQRYPVLAEGVTLKRAFLYATQRDGDGDSYLDEFELPALLRNMIYFTHVRHLCSAADSDGDERLSVNEFIKVALALGMANSPEEASSAFRVADKDGSGTVRLDEMCCWAADHCCPLDSARGGTRVPKVVNVGVIVRLSIIQVSLLNDLLFTGEHTVHIIASLGKQTFTSSRLKRPACVYRWAVTQGSGVLVEFPLPCLRMLSSGPPLLVRVFQTEPQVRDDALQIHHRKLVATRELGAFTLSLAPLVYIDDHTTTALECSKLIEYISPTSLSTVVRKSQSAHGGKSHLRVECSWKFQTSQRKIDTSSRPLSAPSTPRRPRTVERFAEKNMEFADRLATPRACQGRQDLTECFFSARRAECARCPVSARQAIDLKRRLGAFR